MRIRTEEGYSAWLEQCLENSQPKLSDRGRVKPAPRDVGRCDRCGAVKPLYRELTGGTWCCKWCILEMRDDHA